MSIPADVRRFGPTSGLVTGWIGVAACVVVVVVVLVDDPTIVSIRVALGALVAAMLVWCFLLRPRILLGAEEVVLRNPFSEWHVPLASVEEVAVQAITAVYTDEGRYDGLAVGRPMRRVMRENAGRGVRRRKPTGPNAIGTDSLPEFVGDQIRLAAGNARSVGAPTPPVVRVWAKRELGLIAALVAVLLFSLAW